MRFSELDAYVRANTDKYRLYDWQQIEDMREDLASYGQRLSSLSLDTSNDQDLVDAINQLRKELRNEKNYVMSDRLRDILVGTQHKVSDVTK